MTSSSCQLISSWVKETTMNFFKNMNEPENFDISKYPAYASLPDDARKEVNECYENVYLNNQRMGVRIAQGIAYETAKQMIDEKHIGFAKLKGELAHRKGVSNPGALAAYIGDKKYGKKAMQKGAKNHHALGEDEESSSPDSMYETDIEFKDPQGDYAKNPKGATYEGEIKFDDPQGDYSKNPKGATYEGQAQNFQDANDAMVGMTECEHCNGSGCKHCMNEADDFGVTQQAHIPVAYPQSPGGDADVITHAAAIMYNPANAFMNKQGDNQDSGPKAIQKMNHRMKGMNDTASQNEQIDPVIAAAAGYIKHRQEVAGIMESFEVESETEGGLLESFDQIGHGDHVTIKSPQGQHQKGKVVMKSSHGGWVLNMGGAHGTPGLVDSKNYVSHKKAKKKSGFPGDR
jgi:hypothetical protein